MDAQLTILDEFGARLANVTVANGYRFDIASGSIRRAQLTPFQNGDLPAINYWPTTDELNKKEFGKETRSFDVTVEAYAVNPDDPFTDSAFKLGNDIVTALYRATSAPLTTDPKSYALGGLVSGLETNSITPLIVESQDPWFAVLLSFNIKYNITTGDFSAIQSY